MDREEYAEASRRRRREMEREEDEQWLAMSADVATVYARQMEIDREIEAAAMSPADEREFRDEQHAHYGAGPHNPRED